MANVVSRAVNTALAVILPKKKPKPDGFSSTSTFNPTNVDNPLSAPSYRSHLEDIFATRTSLDSRALIKSLMVNDPDMSATVNSYLTVADTVPMFLVKDQNDQIDTAGQLTLVGLIKNLTVRNDYVSENFRVTKSLSHMTEEMRYMILAQGCLGSELVLNKELWPSEIRTVDMNTIDWFEKKPGKFTPRQTTLDGSFIDMDIPTFCVSWYRQDPTQIYSTSPFVSAINTIAARQQVINDLYRIMKVTGYPRMDVTILEEVLVKNMPKNIDTPVLKDQYIRNQLSSVTTALGNLRPEQAFVHTDSVSADTVNSSGSAMSLDIDSIIKVLNAQNQAGLRVMSSIIGRGESGVNTASAEARIFSMNADALNKPIAENLSQVLTLALRLTGSLSNVEVSFKNAEMRPALELEPQLTMKAARLKADLSLGLITDEHYHLEMYGRLPPPGAPVLSGTGFDAPTPTVDPAKAAVNNDPTNNTTPPGSASAKSNGVVKKTK